MLENINENEYEIEISGEGIKVSQPISRQLALQVLSLLMGNNTSIATEMPYGKNFIIPETTITTKQVIDPKAFMATKRPISDVERITCLAYYLSQYRNISQYKTRELTDLNVESSQPRFSNATVAARNAVQQQYLSLAGKGKKQITTKGEAVVNALPDREKVKRALEENIFRPKRRKHLKTKTKKEEKMNN